jgi:hypothetical protein
MQWRWPDFWYNNVFVRHTHGTTLAMQGVPMGVIAVQLAMRGRA